MQILVRTAVVLLLAACGAADVLAQDPQRKPRDLSELSLEELMLIQVDEVYGASRYVQKIADAPASVTVVTADEIKRYGYRSLADVFRGMRGAYVTYDRQYSYLGLRGFNQTSDYNDRILFLIDGHRGNDPLYDAGTGSGDSLLDIDDIERIEVIRGPASSLYGSNAYLGVVNLTSRRGRDQKGLESSASVGSFGTRKASLSWGGNVDEDLELRISGTALRSDGQDLHFPEWAAPATNSGFTAGADAEDAYHLLLQASSHGLTLEGAFFYREKIAPTAPWGTVFPSRNTDTLDQRAFLELKYEHEFDGHLVLQARVSGDAYWFEGNYEYDAGGGSLYLNTTRAHAYALGGEILLSKPFFAGALKVTAGAEHRENFDIVQRNFDDVSPRVFYLDSDESSAVTAGFLQAEARLLPTLLLNAGLRIDHYDTFGNAVAPRAALIWQPSPDTAVKALFGRAFRAPSAAEFFYEDGFTQKLNPDLAEETIDTYELALEQALPGGFRTTLSAFHYRMQDMIALQLDPNDGLLFFDNLNEVRTLGVEAELTAKLPDGVEAGLSYAYQEAKTVDPDQWLVNSPRNLAKGRLSVPLVAEKLFASLEVQFVGDRKSLAGEVVDRYAVVNLTLFGRELLKNLEFSAGVTNLLDASFHDPAGVQHVMDRLEQDGAAFFLKATYRF